MEFTTIKTKKLRNEVNNVITFIEFGEHFRIYEMENLILEVEKAEEGLEAIKSLGKLKNSYIDDFVKKLEQYIKISREKVKTLKDLSFEENEMLNDIKANYHRLPNGTLTYNVEYFKSRLPLLRGAKLTSEISEREEDIMKESKWEGYEWYKKDKRK